MVEPGSRGQGHSLTSVVDSTGTQLWFAAFLETGLSFSKTALVTQSLDDGPLILQGTGPTIPVYVLTDVGFAISSILPNNEQAVLNHLVEKIRSVLTPSEVRVYERSPVGDFSLVRVSVGPSASDGTETVSDPG
jgi:hypothetical protein